MSVPDDSFWMRLALDEARQAAHAGDVPVGAVVVLNDGLLARGRNRKQVLKDPTHHAEIEALRAACRSLGHWHLEECTLYSTLELCPMCYGACIQARVGRIVCGAPEPKFGAMGSVVDLRTGSFNHRPDNSSGVEREACAAIMRQFFREKRER